MELSILQKIQKTRDAILSLKNFNPTIAIVIGSGLGDIKKQFRVHKTIKYFEVPYFSNPTVQGHNGELLLSTSNNVDLIIFNGRLHYYEGIIPKDVTYNVRVMKFLGIKTLILTAAVGGLNKKYSTGDIVILNDHIDFTGNSPLIGPHLDEFGERFPNMEDVYCSYLRKKALDMAKNFNIKVHEGVYFGVSGPAYETPAAVKAFQILGGDVVGMSIVYEATVAAQMKMDVLGLTYIANMAASLHNKTLSHSEVLENGKKVSVNMSKIIKSIVAFIGAKK
jgi:purine-nucleoside phosphorylase